jgi:hypothetical protein
VKRESRVLAYGLLGDYVVLATYRANFLEELNITRQAPIDLEVYLRDKIRTYSEVTYTVPCTESKYSARFKSFRVVEGGDSLLYASEYCKIVLLVLCLLEASSLRLSTSGFLISDLERCLIKGVTQ